MDRNQRLAVAVAAADQARRDAKVEEERRNREFNDRVCRNREVARQEYDSSDRGACKTEQMEAERIMRMETPDTLDAIGSVVGDPLRGPAS